MISAIPSQTQSDLDSGSSSNCYILDLQHVGYFKVGKANVIVRRIGQLEALGVPTLNSIIIETPNQNVAHNVERTIQRILLPWRFDLDESKCDGRTELFHAPAFPVAVSVAKMIARLWDGRIPLIVSPISKKVVNRMRRRVRNFERSMSEEEREQYEFEIRREMSQALEEATNLKARILKAPKKISSESSKAAPTGSRPSTRGSAANIDRESDPVAQELIAKGAKPVDVTSDRYQRSKASGHTGFPND